MSLFDRLPRRADPHSLAAPYALDALEHAERVRFERHLDTCARCTAEVRALAEDAVRLAWSTARARTSAVQRAQVSRCLSKRTRSACSRASRA